MRNELLAATMLLGISGSVIAASRDVHGSAPGLVLLPCRGTASPKSGAA
jgi:hypothetical protein